MDSDQLREQLPRLTAYLKQFSDRFARQDTRAYLSIYVEGQLADLAEKSCKPIALAAGVPPRDLQEFLAHYRWDENRARQRVQQLVMKDHGGPHRIAMINKTSDVKKGDKTPGVKRQSCGTRSTAEDCIVTVHMVYAQEDFHCLLDGDL